MAKKQALGPRGMTSRWTITSLLIHAPSKATTLITRNYKHIRSYRMMSDISIESLIHQVEELERSNQIETIERLTRENALIDQLIVAYQKRWYRMMELLEQAQQALAGLQMGFEHIISEEIAAEKGCLASWGIQRGDSGCSRQSAGGWI